MGHLFNLKSGDDVPPYRQSFGKELKPLYPVKEKPLKFSKPFNKLLINVCYFPDLVTVTEDWEKEGAGGS